MLATAKLGRTATSMEVREEVVTIPWYQEGLGEQEPTILTFRCIIRPSRGLTRFYIDSVDFVGEDPLSITRLRYHKKGMSRAIRAALSDIYDVELARIGNIDRRVMWYYNAMNA